MKRFISIILLTLFMLSAAVPAMAADCYYYDSYGVHAYTQDSFSYPTCTEPGYIILKCTVCGKTSKEETGDAYGHNWYKAAEKAATCTEKGYIYYCCDECYSEKTETIKALGHKYKVLEVLVKPTCAREGTERVQCGVCDKVTNREIERLDHIYGDWMLAVPATDNSMGEYARYCSECGKEDTDAFYPDGTLYRDIKDKEAVKVLQTQLAECGYLNDKVDGIFGKKTEQAVKDFQSKAGINADGIAWPQTNKQLEIEWQKLKGIYVEEIEVIEFLTIAASCCSKVENEDGSVEYVYCADHKVLMDAVDTLLEEELTAEELISTLQLVRQMHQEEVDMRYAEWLELSAEEDKATVVGAQTMFTGLLNVQETIWNKQYGEKSAEALTKINDMLHDQWVELCGIIDLISAE